MAKQRKPKTKRNTKPKLGTAQFLKRLTHGRGVMNLYKLTPPIPSNGGNLSPQEKYEYVVVSAIPYAFDHGGPETFMFGAKEDGHIIDWGELGASQRGTIDHIKVLRESGYKVI